tara:strand:- start:45 stop:785 length:741 start_codon:yes stop_codon:yes gene_type:complete
MVFCAILSAMMFGDSGTKVTGEFSSNVTFGDSISFTTPYTGIVISGDDWELSTNLSNGMVNIEEAKYNWAITDKVTATFGSQALPYGIAWGLHRPSQNAFVSVPREHMVGNGVGLSTSVYGVGIQTFYGNDEYWAGRLSYSLWDQTIGLSVDGNEALLIDVSSKASVLGFPIETSVEYDLSEESDSAFWIRSTMTPTFAKGASILVGFNSDDDLIYGLGFKCSDKCFLSSELSAEGDKLIRVSYSF